MNIDLARTFIAVVESGSFARVGKHEEITQSAVSMRIKALEDGLGKTLFDRGKAGAVLTPSGIQFQKHALTFLRVWEQARIEASLPEDFRAAIFNRSPVRFVGRFSTRMDGSNARYRARHCGQGAVRYFRNVDARMGRRIT
ncbi:MAG: LysR family transcriptional regulator [Rhodospirillales bacterium]|nr:LysR family transcriptional regulator [Rhodospirillales bacterium]